MEVKSFVNKMTQAVTFAEIMHGDQKWGVYPYMVHLRDVWRIIVESGFSDPTKETHQTLQIAAYLHDVVEDTDATSLMVGQDFGGKVGDLVWAVTGTGKNRKARQQMIYECIHQVPDFQAVILKVADRISNVEGSLRDPGCNTDYLEVYRGEWEKFSTMLHRGKEGDTRLSAMWTRLDRALHFHKGVFEK